MQAKVPHQERLLARTSTPRAEASRSIGPQSHPLDNFINPQQRARLWPGDHLNPKLPTNTYFKTFLSSSSPGNKHAQVPHQQRLIASTSTPQAKASRSIVTQSYRHNGLTNPHNNEHAEIPARSGFVLQQSELSGKISKPRPHQKVCTLRSSIKNVLSPALARYEQNHHASFERDHAASTAWQTHNNEHAEIPSQSEFVLTRTQRFQQSTLIPKISKLALTREHALQSTASRMSPHEHKHAKSRSITQH